MSTTRPRSIATVDRALRWRQEFLRLEVAGGLLLMAVTVLAMIVANSPLYRFYAAALDASREVRIGTAQQGGVGTIGLERLGIVVGSLLAGLAGYVVLRSCLASPAEAVPPP